MSTAPARLETERRGASNTERAYVELKRRILSNALSPGSQALEQELAGLLEMSRTPVREALIRLAEEGLVEVRPRHGVRVLPISPDDMREIYEVLTELEAAAARIAAERGVGEADLAALDTAVAEMDRALAAGDLDLWAAADERFHKGLVEACGNRRIRQVVNTYWDQAHRARMVTLRLRPLPTGSNDDHAALVAAIRARDAASAHAIHREHRVRNGAMLVALLEKYRLNSL